MDDCTKCEGIGCAQCSGEMICLGGLERMEPEQLSEDAITDYVHSVNYDGEYFDFNSETAWNKIHKEMV